MPPTPEWMMRASTSSVPSLLQRAHDGLDRALHVALDDQRELLAAGFLELLHHLLERARGAGRAQRLAALADAVVGDLAGARLVLDDGERIAGLGRASRSPGPRPARMARPAATVSPLIVDQRAHAAPGRCRPRRCRRPCSVPRCTSTRADRAAAALQLGLDDDAFGERSGLALRSSSSDCSWMASSSLSRPVRLSADTAPRAFRPTCSRPRSRAAAARCARAWDRRPACRSC